MKSVLMPMFVLGYGSIILALVAGILGDKESTTDLLIIGLVTLTTFLLLIITTKHG